MFDSSKKRPQDIFSYAVVIGKLRKYYKISYL